MADEYPFVSGVRSNLIEQQIKQESTPQSPNTILIFGTAEKGPLLTPTRITPANAETIFGANINSAFRIPSLRVTFIVLNVDNNQHRRFRIEFGVEPHTISRMLFNHFFHHNSNI